MTARSVFVLASGLLLAIAAALPARATPAAALPAWEQLTPEQREQLIAPVRDRWNAEPAQRERMLLHAQRWQNLTPEQRRHARHGVKRWQTMDPEHREQMRAVFAHVRTLPEAERRAFMAKWRAMSPEQKRAWLQAHPSPAPRPVRLPSGG